MGAGAVEEQMAVGQTLHLAARLRQSLAQPNTILMSEATHDQVRLLFETEDLGTARAERLQRGATGLARAPTDHFVRPVKDTVCHRTTPIRRPNQGTRFPARPVAAHRQRRWPRRAHFGRAGHRQVATARRAGGEADRSSPLQPAVFLLAAPSGRRTLSDHLPLGARTWFRPQRLPR